MPVTSEFAVSKKWLIVSILFYLPLSLLDLVHKYFIRGETDLILNPIQKFIFSTSTIYHVVFTFFYTLTLLLNRNILDEIILQIGKLEEYKNKKISSLVAWHTFFGIYLAVHIAILIMFGFTNSSGTSNFAVQLIFHITPYFRSIMVLLLYCNITKLAGNAVQQLKKTLIPSFHQVIFKYEKFEDAIQLIRLNNQFFSLQLILFAAQCLIFITLHAYNIIHNIRFNIKNFDFFKILLESGDMVGGFQLLMLYCTTVSDTKNKIEKFNRKIFKLLMKHRELRKNERLKNQILRNCEVDFNVCGFFYGGYPLVTSILEAVVTYIVMLIQFNP
ncbi:uncharacterized protein [Halyomorpha halys]|uniref:uncharacterized protein n=1 Tax=Halyomorpha halys TaxID=286706 RepID=UPI0034D29A02